MSLIPCELKNGLLKVGKTKLAISLPQVTNLSTKMNQLKSSEGWLELPLNGKTVLKNHTFVVL